MTLSTQSNHTLSVPINTRSIIHSSFKRCVTFQLLIAIYYCILTLFSMNTQNTRVIIYCLFFIVNQFIKIINSHLDSIDPLGLGSVKFLFQCIGWGCKVNMVYLLAIIAYLEEPLPVFIMFLHFIVANFKINRPDLIINNSKGRSLFKIMDFVNPILLYSFLKQFDSEQSDLSLIFLIFLCMNSLLASQLRLILNYQETDFIGWLNLNKTLQKNKNGIDKGLQSYQLQFAVSYQQYKTSCYLFNQQRTRYAQIQSIPQLLVQLATSLVGIQINLDLNLLLTHNISENKIFIIIRLFFFNQKYTFFLSFHYICPFFFFFVHLTRIFTLLEYKLLCINIHARIFQGQKLIPQQFHPQMNILLYYTYLVSNSWVLLSDKLYLSNKLQNLSSAEQKQNSQGLFYKYLSSKTLALITIAIRTNPSVMLTKLNTKCFLEILGRASKMIIIAVKELIIMLYIYEFVLLKTVKRIIILIILKICRFRSSLLGSRRQSQLLDLFLYLDSIIQQKSDIRLRQTFNNQFSLLSFKAIEFSHSFIFSLLLIYLKVQTFYFDEQMYRKVSIRIMYIYQQIFFQMYKNSTIIQRLSRGSSRGVANVAAQKATGLPNHSSIKKTDSNYYQSGILKNSSKPAYQTAMKNSMNQQNSKTYTYGNHGYGNNYSYSRIKQKDPKYGLISNMNSNIRDNSDGRDSRNQQFRIRSNIKQNIAMTNSRKTEKDQEQRNIQLQKEKQMTQSKRRHQELRKQLQKQEELYAQKLLKQKQQAQLRRKNQERQREKQKQKERQREREREREKEKEKQRKQRSQQLTSNSRKNNQMTDSKPQTSMNNSTTTGTSDYSSSSYKISNYGYSNSSSKSIGLVGLNNIGNTCFMNSILQCVFNLPGFNDYFLAGKHLDQMKSGARVAQAYARTIKTMRSSTSKSETPSELKSAIGAKKSIFSGYSQQDAQQFLVALLQLLSIDLNRSKNPKYKQLTADVTKQSLKQISDDWWNYNKQRQDSIVSDFFSGQVLSRVVCSKCKNQSIAFDNIWDMALDFSPNDRGDIMKMIQNFLKEQIISDDYYCSKCKAFRQCQRKIDFYRLPKILVFQLKRFSYGRFKKVKLNNRVKVQTTLDLSSVITQSNHSSVKNPIYNLVGVVNHSGDIDFGHYTAECRNPINGKWYDFNDSSVHEINIRGEFQSSSPYLLFYAKKDI